MSTHAVHCRLCADLKPYSELVDLEDDKEKKIRVLEKLSRLNIHVTSLDSKDDVLPKTVCTYCVDSLHKAFHFALDVETAQEALKIHLLVQNIKKDLTDDGSCETEYVLQDIKEELDSSEGNTPIDNDVSIFNLNVNEIPNNSDSSPNIKTELHTDLESNSNSSNLKTDAENAEDNEFQMNTDEPPNENELKNGHEEDLDVNDFKKDFEVTVAGYQMEITSKLTLTNTRNDSVNNESQINDNYELTDPVSVSDFNEDMIQNDYSINNENLYSLKNESNKVQTRKRKLNDTENYNDSKTENEKTPIVDVQHIGLNAKEQDDTKTNKPIMVLNKISIHTGNKNVLIISPLTKSKHKPYSGIANFGVDLTMSSDENECIDNTEMSVNKHLKQPENKQVSLHNKSSQSKNSWKDYIWKCHDCKKVFDSIDSLITHSKQTHNCCNNYQCIDCAFHICKLNTFIDHIKTHREYLRLSCFRCYKVFAEPGLVQTHYNSHVKSQHICIGCHEIFHTKNKLEKHNEMYKREITNSFSSKVEYKPAMREEKPVDRTLLEKQYICDHCGKLFIYKHFLIYHIKINHKL